MKEYKVLEKLVTFLKQKPIEGRFRVAAIALDSKGQILSIRSNEYTKTHPKMAHLAFKQKLEDKIYLHAEVAAIIAAGWRQKRIHTMIIVRVLKDGALAMAKPCPICQQAIKEARIKHTFYTDRQGSLVLLN